MTSYINLDVASCWNKRLNDCIKNHGYTQESFAKAFKGKYHTGTQADISRWIRVGGTVTRKATIKEGDKTKTANKRVTIGFPSYENMKRIADFFGVTVGYLTGETDCETFDMERTCTYLGINEAAGTAIERITKGKGERKRLAERYLEEQYSAALCYLLTADSFRGFVHCLCELAEAIKRQQNPINYMEKVSQKIKSEIRPLAMECMNYGLSEENEDALEPTPELLHAIGLLNDAQDKGVVQPILVEQNLKLAKYALYEKYFRLIDEVVCKDHLDAMTVRLLEEITSIKEPKLRVETEALS